MAVDQTYIYHNQAELTLQVVEKLGETWNSLSPDFQSEMGGLLAQVRTQLVQVAGDASSNTATAVFQAGRLRDAVLGSFLMPRELADGSGRRQSQARSRPCAGSSRRVHRLEGPGGRDCCRH